VVGIAEVVEEHDGATLVELHPVPGDVDDGDVVGVGPAVLAELAEVLLDGGPGCRNVSGQQRLDAGMDRLAFDRRQQHPQTGQRALRVAVLVDEPSGELGGGASGTGQVLDAQRLPEIRSVGTVGERIMADADHESVGAGTGSGVRNRQRNQGVGPFPRRPVPPCETIDDSINFASGRCRRLAALDFA
jgi:hypothetical protein